MPLSNKVRVEIFIPDVPDPAYSRLSDELGDELSYAFGGCTAILAAGKYCSDSGVILPDRVNLLFVDVPLTWERDRLSIERYASFLHAIAERALTTEEAVLIAVYPVCHVA